eukprot:423300_1
MRSITPTLPLESYATIARQKSDTTSPRIIIRTPSYHHLPPLNNINITQEKSISMSSNNSPTNTSSHTHQPNSILTSTPKRRKRKRRRQKHSNKCHLVSSINHPQYKQLLISGFIHTTFNIFPTDLHNLILKYYDEITYWTITDSQMTTFKSLKNGQCLFGPKFNINKIRFESTLCPSGWKKNQKGSVQFYIELKSLPAYIASISVYYELSCKQTHSFCKKIRTFKKQTDA